MGGKNVENLFWLNFVFEPKKIKKIDIFFWNYFFEIIFFEIIFFEIIFFEIIFFEIIFFEIIFHIFFFNNFVLPQHVTQNIVYCLLRLTTQADGNL